MIRLQNTAKIAQTFNLTTELAPIRANYKRARVHKDGSFERKATRVVHPDSITLLAGQISRNLPDAVQKAPEIAAALAAQSPRLIVLEAEAEATEASQTQTEVSTTEVSTTEEPATRSHRKR